MKFSVNWLANLSTAEARELADLLTLAGVEIEGIEKRGANFDNVVVAQITASIATSECRSAERLPGR